MSENVSKILVVLANPNYLHDTRAGTISTLAKTFIETTQKRGITVDVIDLYNEEDFNPIFQPDEQDTKVLEYQIRVRKADLLVFFHPVYWALPPAILKGFIEKVFTAGFAYKINKNLTKGLFNDKKALVITTSEKSVIEFKYIYRNILDSFWKRAFFDVCGIRKSKIIHFGSLRSVKEKTLHGWTKKIQLLGEKVNSKESILDLF